MRRSPFLLCALALSLAAPVALAAPTCWNGQGETVRCATPGALPVGTPLTRAQRALRETRTGGADPLALAGLAMLLGGLVGLIALLPDFQRWER